MLSKIAKFIKVVVAVCILLFFLDKSRALSNLTDVNTTLEQQLIDIRNRPQREVLLSLQEALSRIPAQYGVSDDIIAVIIAKESGGRMDAIRYESSQMRRASKFTKNPEQQKMLASSHCAMQVMGYNAAAKGVSWTELYKPEVCVEMGMNIWANCREKQCKGKTSVYDCIHASAACYNGSTKYADDFMVRLSKRIIDRGA